MASVGYQISITATDAASAVLNKLNARMAAFQRASGMTQMQASAQNLQRTLAKTMEVSGINNVKDAFGKLHNNIRNTVSGVQSLGISLRNVAGALGLISGLSIAGIGKILSAGADFGNKLTNQSAFTGVPTPDLQHLQNAGELALGKGGNEAMQNSIANLEKLRQDVKYKRITDQNTRDMVINSHFEDTDTTQEHMAKAFDLVKRTKDMEFARTGDLRRAEQSGQEASSLLHLDPRLYPFAQQGRAGLNAAMKATDKNTLSADQIKNLELYRQSMTGLGLAVDYTENTISANMAPAMSRLNKTFTDFVHSDGVQNVLRDLTVAASGFIDEINTWLKNPENIKQLEADFLAVKNAIVDAYHGVMAFASATNRVVQAWGGWERVTTTLIKLWATWKIVSITKDILGLAAALWRVAAAGDAAIAGAFKSGKAGGSKVKAALSGAAGDAAPTTVYGPPPAPAPAPAAPGFFARGGMLARGGLMAGRMVMGGLGGFAAGYALNQLSDMAFDKAGVTTGKETVGSALQYGATGAGIGAAFGPLGALAGAGIGASIGIVIANWDDIAKKLKTWGTSISSWLSDASSWLGKKVEDLKEYLGIKPKQGGSDARQSHPAQPVQPDASKVPAGPKPASGGGHVYHAPAYQNATPAPTAPDAANANQPSAAHLAVDQNGPAGMNADQFGAYQKGITAIENPAEQYDKKGGSGNLYNGKYQMGMPAISDSAKHLGEPVPTREQFLNDPAMQERYFKQYTADNNRYLMQHNAAYSHMTPEQRARVLGYAHSQGAGGANQFLRTGVPKRDGNGYDSTNYMKSVGNRLAALHPPGWSPISPANAQEPVFPKPTQPMPAPPAFSPPATDQAGPSPDPAAFFPPAGNTPPAPDAASVPEPATTPAMRAGPISRTEAAPAPRQQQTLHQSWFPNIGKIFGDFWRGLSGPKMPSPTDPVPQGRELAPEDNQSLQKQLDLSDWHRQAPQPDADDSESSTMNVRRVPPSMANPMTVKQAPAMKLSSRGQSSPGRDGQLHVKIEHNTDGRVTARSSGNVLASAPRIVSTALPSFASA